jgi:hypothetical protein
MASAAIANKIKPILSFLISEDQTELFQVGSLGKISD